MSREVIFSETSQIHKKNRIVIIIGVMVFIVLLASSVYKWVALGIRQPIEVFIDLMFIFVLFERSQAKYICELGKKQIYFTKKSLWGKKEHVVDYKDIRGVYRYKSNLINVIKFRRTFRMNSALDNRIVWSLAYQVPNSKGKLENRRIFFKASEEMLNLLAEKMPNRVKVKEEQVVLEMMDN